MSSELNVLALELGKNFITIAGGIVSGNSLSKVSFVESIAFPETINFYSSQTQADFDFLKEEISPILSEKKFDATHLIVSLPGTSSFIRTVEVDNLSEKLKLEHVEWEINQITENRLSEYSLIFPDVHSENFKVIMALPNKMLETAKLIAKLFLVELVSVGLSSLHIASLVASQKTNSDYHLLINSNNGAVEFNTISDDLIFVQNRFFYPNGLDYNDLNMKIRAFIENENDSERTIETILLAGNDASKEVSEIIANATLLSVEIVRPFSAVKFENPDEFEKISEEYSKFSAVIGSFF
jgi:hypothetical protein